MLIRERCCSTGNIYADICHRATRGCGRFVVNCNNVA